MTIFNIELSEQLLKNAIFACEYAKRRNDYATANKYFAVALITQIETSTGFLFLEGEMDYYGLLHVAVKEGDETTSVCCPIPMLKERFVDISAQLPRVERKIHNRVFDYETPEYSLDLTEKHLDDFFYEVFRSSYEPCYYLKYKKENDYVFDDYVFED